MSMTVVTAKIYVARIIGGGAQSQESLDMAGEAILRAYQDWQTKKFWRFLLKDTTVNAVVSGVTATSASAVVNAPSSGALDFVNVGVTVTIAASDTATLAAGTTVLSFTRGTDGTIATITLSNAFGGTTDTSATLTFTSPIPIIAGTNEYNLPDDFNAPFSARLTTTPRSLVWRDQRWWDRTITDQTVRGTPSDYTTYNPYSDLTQNFGTCRLKFDRIPNASDVLLLRYYRKFTTDGTNIDMIDDYLYQFLDYARNLLLATKRAQDDPAQFAKNVGMGLASADEDDEEPTDDNDVEQCMKSQYEVGPGPRMLWGNGDFSPFNY
jgi:hypothetical protein